MSEYCLMIDKRKKYLIGEGEVTKEILEELEIGRASCRERV